MGCSKPTPFALAELVARIQALARRRWVVPDGGMLREADLELDLSARRGAARIG